MRKIDNPSEHDSGWNQKMAIQQKGLLKKWEKDYIRNMELEIIISLLMREMGVAGGKEGVT